MKEEKEIEVILNGPLTLQRISECQILNPREEAVLKMIAEGNSLEEIASKFEVSRERVRQVMLKALRRLRRTTTAD